MSISGKLFATTGEYQGTNSLWLSPEEPAQESRATATTGMAGQGRYFILRYTWEWEGKPQDGLILLGQGDKPDVIKAVWTDSWHMQNKFMHMKGQVLPENSISLLGNYAAPPGPDRGWRIVLETADEDHIKILMFNIPPGGEAELAVETSLVRI